MNSGVVDLLNIIRTKALGQAADRDLLSAADSLEKLFQDQESTLQATHTIASNTWQEKEREIERLSTDLRIAHQKLHLVEERLRLELARRFGRSSEKWTTDEKTQALLFTELEQVLQEPVPEIKEAEHSSSPSAEKRRKAPEARGKREALPDSLCRVDVPLSVEEKDLSCLSCGKTLERIGEEIHEQLEMKPIEFFVKRTIRPVFACRCGEGGVVSAPPEPQVYPKSILGDSVVAQIITSKFADALPFYRQERIFARSGIDVSRQTMARGAAAVAGAFGPLYRLFKERLILSKVIGSDETRVRVLKENGIKKPGLSWMWVLAGVSEEIALVYFHYGGGRDSETARDLLSGFSGVLMSDGYTVYPSAVDSQVVTLAACMAHVRRKFHDCLKVQRGNPDANEALAFIRRLYEIEEQIKGASAEKRTAVRTTVSRPVFEGFRQWLYTKSASMLPQSALGRAVSYAVELLPRLEVYLGDGRVPIDNNGAENAIRPFAVGRKNWLFCDQADGAEVSATLYSIIESAKANSLEPMHYLRFLLRCYRKFGPDALPWEKLLPHPNLRLYAESIGVPWNLG